MKRKISMSLFDVEYLPGKIGTDAASTLLSVTGCLGQGFMDEVPESILRSENFKIREDGWILSASKLESRDMLRTRNNRC